MSHRLHKVNENIQRELSPMIAESDFAEAGFLTLTHVLTTPDLRFATVWMSVLNHPNPQSLIDRLNERSHEFYEPLSDRLKMKYAPQLTFKLDDQSDELNKIDAIIDDIHNEA